MFESVRRQQLLASRRPEPYAQSPRGLHRTWCFRLVILAFAALSTKYVFVAMHGLFGFLIILALAAVAAVCERSFVKILSNALRSGRRNPFMILLAVWYLIGVFGKMYFSGASDTDWRLVMAPIELIIGLLIGFGFLYESKCVRTFQIAVLAMVGVQSLFTAMVIINDPSIVRNAVVETSGGWVYGDQGGFAMQAMLLPILVWRACAEKGVLRLFLLACCATIGWAVAISQFATAFGLLLLSFPTALLLAVRYMKHQARLIHVLAVICIGGMGFLLFQLMQQSSLLSDAGRHIVTAWHDPRSGGYEEKYADLSRWYLAQISLNTFWKYPFLGGGEGSIRYCDLVGGHSAFFDMLGFYGLLGGGGAFVAMLLLMLARAWRRLRWKGDWEAVAVATSVVLLLIGGVVNPYWEGETTVMVLLLGRLFRLPQERGRARRWRHEDRAEGSRMPIPVNHRAVRFLGFRETRQITSLLGLRSL